MLFSKLRAKLRPLVQFRVRRWHTAMRGWDETDARVLITCEDSVWYWALLEWFLWDIQTYACDILKGVKLPDFVLNWKRQWDTDEDADGPCTFKEWYGDCVGCLWHMWVCSPLLQWMWQHKNVSTHAVQFELTLDEARNKFAHDPEQYMWVERSIAEHKQWDAEKAAEEDSEPRWENEGGAKNSSDGPVNSSI